MERFLKKKCKDKVVYWGNPITNSSGVRIFDIPIEINCLWNDKVENLIDNKGREFVSRATIIVLQDIDEFAMVYRGELKNLTNVQKDDPKEVLTSYEVKRFIKIKSLNLNQYVRKIFL